MTASYKPRPALWLTWRFSLRTLFVLVSLLCVWLGVQVQWIRDRHEALRQHRGLENGTIGVKSNRMPNRPIILRGESAKAPWSLRIIGERGIKTLLVYVDDHPFGGQGDDYGPRLESETNRLSKLFPEATIQEALMWLSDEDSRVPYAPQKRP